MAKRSPAKLPDQHRIEERDASNHLAPHIYDFRGDRAFPYLKGRLIRGVRKLVPDEAAQVGPDAQAISCLAIGDVGSQSRQREALLTQIETEPRQSPPAFLDLAIAALALLRDMEVQLLTDGSEDGWTIPICLLLDDDGVIDDMLLVEEFPHTRPRRLAAFRIAKGADRLTVVFIESEPLYPLAYPSESGDENETHKTMFCAAKDFMRRMHGIGAPDIAVPAWDMSKVSAVRAWIKEFF